MSAKRILSALLAAIMLMSVMVTGITAAEAELPFIDVKKDDWFYSYVSYAYLEGLMNGTGNGSTFSPTEVLPAEW